MSVREHIRITARGVFGPPSEPIEEWSWSLRAVTPDPAQPIGQLGPRALAESIASKIVTFHGAASTKIHSVAKLTAVTFAWVGTDDRVKVDGNGAFLQHQVAIVDPQPGSKSSDLHPPQVALCVSLATARGGPTGKGRVFLPAPAFSLTDNGTAGSTDAQNVATNFAGMLTQMNDAFDSEASGPGVRIAVVSSKGYASIVTGVKVGVVLDTQRRRRNDLPEAYTTASVNTLL